MRYMVTGGAGFIGSHLVERLVESNHDVVVLDDFSTGDHANIAHLENHQRFRLIYGDVRDQALVSELIRDVDRVYHLASAVGVQLVIDQPVRTIETIVEGTSVMLRACARYRVPILITSTSEVYGKSTRVPFRECDDSIIGSPSCRRWAYASAKALDEFLAYAYWHESRLPVVLVRLFNTVGPRQKGRYGMVIPRFVRQALLGEPITVYGDGAQSRCFCHVRDVVWALEKLLDTPNAYGDLVNVGNNREVSINELADLVRKNTGSTSSVRHIAYSDVYGENFEDMARRVPDLEKAVRLVEYRPRYSLDEIIRDVANYIRENDDAVERGQLLRTGSA